MDFQARRDRLRGLACVGGQPGLNSEGELQRHSQQRCGSPDAEAGATATKLRTITVMSITVNLSLDEVAEIKRLTRLDNENEAVAKAAREFLRVVQLQELKAVSGRLDYREVGEDLEALELRERQPDR